MTRNSSASVRRQSRTPRKQKPHSIDASLQLRAMLLITDSSIPGQTRNLIQYALEIKDRHLAQLVGRVEGGEMTIDHLNPE